MTDQQDREPGHVVRALWERFEARDWAGAEGFLDPAVVVEWPASSERIAGRDNVIGLNSTYPEPWGHISVLRVFVADEQVAAEIRIGADDATYFCAGFYEVHDGHVTHATEYWVTEGGLVPPIDRSRWTESATRAAAPRTGSRRTAG
jgi:hypothetical protein